MTSSFVRMPALRRGAGVLACVLVLGVVVPDALGAQYPARPWLDWRTLDTRHFSVHFPAGAEPWAQLVAERMDDVREAVGSIVGHAAPGRTHIVVDDPYNSANGFALPALDRPVAVLFTTPPAPVQTIGHFRGWGELLAVHEYAHLAHLTIPARNPRDRLLLSLLSPWPGSPVALRAPRWVLEGYATYIEGRVTAHGRPHNAWRAAVLRQWALEGRLPSYGQLNATDGYLAGSFAYLAGSAFLEHVARNDTLSPHPDSSLAYLWRRMSARTRRSFDAAFSGLHGRSPADAYGRFVKELSSDAVAIERAIADSGGVVQGQLVQRLSWETGDPAVSRDGRFIAAVLRSRDDPSRVVIWRTDYRPTFGDSVPRYPSTPRAAPRVLDTLDVPDRRFTPPPREVIEELRSPIGAPYESPRFMSGDSALLLHRLSPVGDGTLRHDLYVWRAGSGVRRVTHGAGVRDADPRPGGDDTAAAVRCRWGTCDVVSVDLVGGGVRTLLEGSATRSFHRPRWFGNGAGFTVAVHEEGRWRIAIASHDGHGMRLLDPDDGASRYQPTPTRDGEAVVVVSERGGIMNLELLPVQGGAARTLTRVTGAALAPDVDRRDGSVWYLSMHSRGLDLRRLPPGDRTPPAPLVAFDSALSPLVPVAAPYPPRTLAVSALGASRPYGFGPRDVRWLPAGAGGVDGYGGRVVLSSSDLVGRLHLVLTGAGGDAATHRGGALAFASRAQRPTIWGELAYTDQRPSASRARDWRRTPAALQLDARHRAAALGIDASGDWQSHAVRLRAGGQAGVLELLPAAVGSGDARSTPGRRMVGAALVEGTLRQRGPGWSLVQRVGVHGSSGRLHGDDFSRVLATLALSSSGRRVPAIAANVTYGALSGTRAPYERFVVGGVGAPLVDPLFLAQRRVTPLLPLGSAEGSRVLTFRGAVPLGALTLAYAGASANDGGRFVRWQRTIALEAGYATGPIPFLSVPAASLSGGVGRAMDQPGRPVRGYFTVELRP